MDYTQFLAKIKIIKVDGFVPTNRTGDTGVGKTLEDLLGITENNIAGPDFDKYELKSARKSATSMLTLFTKAPMPRKINGVLKNTFGYKQREKGTPRIGKPTYITDCDPREKELHVFVDAIEKNSVGLMLEIRGNSIWIANNKGVEAYYEEDYLRAAFEKKYQHKLIYVLADSKRENGKEHFWYNEAYLLDGFSYEGFLEAIRKATVKLDIRIGHYSDGRPHDHGTGFRVFPKDLPKCFAHIEQIL